MLISEDFNGRSAKVPFFRMKSEKNGWKRRISRVLGWWMKTFKISLEYSETTLLELFENYSKKVASAFFV